ncbi:MAG: universal stress protein [Gammaproteobacteria bacterium]|nr:universal stress protein [Gammaproteobacteria bacterium]
MKSIMVATDFSVRSDRALRRAVILSKQCAATLSLVHVVDDDQPKRIVDAEHAIAAQLLAEQAATLRDIDGIACTTRVVSGPSFAGIVRETEESKPDLLVLGPHRRQALRDVFVGTTAERTIRSVSRPALMANATPVGPYRHVLLTTDMSDASRHAVESFLTLDFARNARSSILHVFDAPAMRPAMADSMPRNQREQILQDEREGAEAELSAFVAALKTRPMAQTVRHESATIANEILAAAREIDADLIVVGTRGRGGDSPSSFSAALPRKPWA